MVDFWLNSDHPYVRYLAQGSFDLQTRPQFVIGTQISGLQSTTIQQLKYSLISSPIGLVTLEPSRGVSRRAFEGHG
ncbi:hypothetical protein IFM89_006079 [Coptis chinensis]|uniref:Uncharacterized protein n=1 Tax=Coptis chinensis TaxID=261450 RepID=A0A835H703_9MAGN|nr:hypothetical protein IFM89_006079 [Coptis chinensis]